MSLPLRSDSLLLIFISLYLVLIAFFFVLNSYADRAAVRERKTLDSLSAAFSRVALPRASEADQPRDTGHFAEDKAYVLAAVETLGQHIDGLDVRGGAEVDQATVIVPLGALFDEGRVTVRRDRLPVLDALAALAEKAPFGAQRDLRILLGSGQSRVLPRPEGKARIALLRAGALGRALRERGYPRGGFGVGLTPGREDRIAFVFISRPELGSRVQPRAGGGEDGG